MSGSRALPWITFVSPVEQLFGGTHAGRITLLRALSIEPYANLEVLEPGSLHSGRAMAPSTAIRIQPTRPF